MEAGREGGFACLPVDATTVPPDLSHISSITPRTLRPAVSSALECISEYKSLLFGNQFVSRHRI